jgi:hypothetical protein
MLRALICCVIGCGGSPKVVSPPPAQVDAGVVAVDPPEPKQPVAECTFAPTTSCRDGDAATAQLAPPFETCAASQPAREMAYPGEGMFSAVETRKARASNPRACCYVEFVTQVCL